MDDEAKWKRRFTLFMGARLLGLGLFLGGMAITFTDVVRDGGWPAVGAVLMVVGLAGAVIAPKLLKKQWLQEDRAAVDRPGDGQTDR